MSNAIIKAVIAACLAALTLSPLLAQEVEGGPPGRMATCDDFVGFWQVIPLKDDSANEVNPWPLPYQWFVFYEDGRVSSLMKTEPLDLSREDLAKILEPLKELSPKYWCQGPRMVIQYEEMPDQVEIWGKNYFTRRMETEKTADVEAGDILMTLASPDDQRMIYFRHLRPLQ